MKAGRARETGCLETWLLSLHLPNVLLADSVSALDKDPCS